MSTWTPFTDDVVLAAMSVDMRTAYDAWIVAHPEKADRLMVLVADTLANFRDAVAANLANWIDPELDTVPSVGLRHAVNVTLFSLAAEMSFTLPAELATQVTRADIWLRLVQNGTIPIPQDPSQRGGHPSYHTPAEREPRPVAVL